MRKLRLNRFKILDQGHTNHKDSNGIWTQVSWKQLTEPMTISLGPSVSGGQGNDFLGQIPLLSLWPLTSYKNIL